MAGKKSRKVCHFASTEDVKLADNIQKWWDIETHASEMNVVSQSRKKQEAQKFLESTTKFRGERYEVGMLLSEPEPNLPNNNGSALGQLYSLERRLQKDPKLKNFFSCNLMQMLKKDLWRSWTNRKSEALAEGNGICRTIKY